MIVHERDFDQALSFRNADSTHDIHVGVKYGCVSVLVGVDLTQHGLTAANFRTFSFTIEQVEACAKVPRARDDVRRRHQ